jgi:molecular chaperone HscA
MSVVIGIDLGHDAVRVAALVDDRAEAVATMPAWVGWDGDAIVVGEAARARPPAARLGRLPSWLERTTDDADDGGVGGPGPLGSRWPIAGGAARAPAEALACLVRAAALAAEERHGPVLGAVLAVDPSLGVVGRRALRDAASLAGLPAARLLAAPACVALVAPGGADGACLVGDAGAGALSLSVVERVGGAIHVLAHLRDRELGGDALDSTVADALDVAGATIDLDDPAWPALCRLARAIKERAAADELAALAGRLDGRATLPDVAELERLLDARLRRLDELCQRVLAAAGLAAHELADALLIGGGARLTGLAPRLASALGRPPVFADDPAATVALGAATAARMFLAEPAALFLDVMPEALALSDGHALEPLIAAATVAPARARQVVASEQGEQEHLTVELWAQGPRTRPYARYRIDGMPAAPAGDAIAIVDVLVDADLVPRLTARELASGAALAVTAVEEAALAPADRDALRERIAAWRP